MTEVITTFLPGLFLLYPDKQVDDRGSLIKTMQTSLFAERGWRSDFKESYFSISNTNVLRGMHFQTPPADGPKLVACLSGRVHDALLDLRISAPTYGRHVLIPMDGNQPCLIYMPAGIAHGFWVEEGPSTMLYYQCAEYAPDHDKGIGWDKAGIQWPFQESPVVSSRDLALPVLTDFVSPFI